MNLLAAVAVCSGSLDLSCSETPVIFMFLIKKDVWKRTTNTSAMLSRKDAITAR